MSNVDLRLNQWVPGLRFDQMGRRMSPVNGIGDEHAQLVADVAHELRTPLATVENFRDC